MSSLDRISMIHWRSHTVEYIPMTLSDYGLFFHIFDFQYTICKTRKPKGIHTLTFIPKVIICIFSGLTSFIILISIHTNSGSRDDIPLSRLLCYATLYVNWQGLLSCNIYTNIVNPSFIK